MATGLSPMEGSELFTAGEGRKSQETHTLFMAELSWCCLFHLNSLMFQGELQNVHLPSHWGFHTWSKCWQNPVSHVTHTCSDTEQLQICL